MRAAAGIIALLLSATACVAWIALRPETPLPAAVAVFAATYLLVVAAEFIQFDLPNALGIPFVASVSMLPACAVSGYYAAGGIPQANFTGYAASFATGVENLLIPAGWFAVLALYGIRSKHAYVLANVRMRIELISLLLAALYWFVIVIKGSLALYDAAVLLIIFIIYIRISVRRRVHRAPIEGAFVRKVADRSAVCRRLLAAAMIALAAWTFASALEPFAVGFLSMGGVQSVALVMALNIIVIAVGCSLRLKPHIGLALLVSSAIGGISLLVVVVVCAHSIAGSTLTSIALDGGNRAEFFMSASLILFALVVVMDLKFSWKGAVVLAIAFIVGLIVPIAAVRYSVGSACIVLSVALLAKDRLARNGLKHTMRAAWRLPQDPSFNHLSEH